MKKLITVLCGALLCFAVLAPTCVRADEAEPIKIYTVTDMQDIAANPSGSYILMNDLDMTDVVWPSIIFTGTFDGNGHALLNLSVSSVSEETRQTYDGNRIVYDTHFGGLFSIMENATVKNLKLIGINVESTYEGDCFLGTVAGYFSASTIENCEISGTVRLDVTGKMFGVGGIAGFGNGSVLNNKVDITLINIDLDKATRDEQFLGGAIGSGYPDMRGNEVKLAGYISDHGYVHSGGLLGMYIIYPLGFARDGFFTNNTLSGFITFFEDNTDRRAYCSQGIGETMDWYFTNSNNTYNFKRDERFDYSKNLLPHSCEDSQFTVEVTDPTCSEFGYTTYTCTTDGCGYSFRSNYTAHNHSVLTETAEIKAATLESEGLKEYTCSECGEKVYITVAKLVPTPTPSPEPTPTNTPTPTPETNGNGSQGSTPWGLIITAAILAVIFFVVLGLIISSARQREKDRYIK